MATTIILMVLCATTSAVDSIARKKITRMIKVGSEVTFVGNCLYNIAQHMEEIEAVFNTSKKMMNIAEPIGKVAIKAFLPIK